MELIGGVVMEEVGHWDGPYAFRVFISLRVYSDSCLWLRCKEIAKRPAAMSLLRFLPVVTFGCGILS